MVYLEISCLRYSISRLFKSFRWIVIANWFLGNFGKPYAWKATNVNIANAILSNTTFAQKCLIIK